MAPYEDNEHCPEPQWDENHIDAATSSMKEMAAELEDLRRDAQRIRTKVDKEEAKRRAGDVQDAKLGQLPGHTTVSIADV